ncbi:hypothetical protein [Nocardioides bruguierae]|uniref:Uncharacterized protein n=1 Tax=Nocardioides bruguierae TaxID=2945102 RepID=A0A9X2IGE6_9ACTN|nr:hypothetical protein [Nocardioides bruguierae]MCM0622806.1 hypothetical protein [Nocardioides bruguierae]
MTLSFQGCSSAPDAVGRGQAWSIVIGDTQGVIVSDGHTTRGFRRGSSEPIWEANGEPNGAACSASCPDAVLNMVGGTDLLQTHGSNVDASPLNVNADDIRTLGTAGNSIILTAMAGPRHRLYSWTNGTVDTIKILGRGSALWQSRGRAGGTLFLLREHRTTATVLDFTGTTATTTTIPKMPHRTMCYDAQGIADSSLSSSAFATLKTTLTFVSACLPVTAHRWLGIGTSLSLDPATGKGSPTLVAAVTTASCDAQPGCSVW